MKELLERNKLIKARAAKGDKSYSEVGALFGISKQRVHQIVTGYSSMKARGELEVVASGSH